jgi:putative DNA primase/helicase
MADTVSAALRELQRGHQPLAFDLGQKGPRITAWQNLRYTAEQIPYAFKGKNIGVILGAVSGGLFDVDLDCDEAAELADTFLPKTEMVAGRVSRPRTHRFYRTMPALPLEQFRDPRDGKMLVELRSSNGEKGYQTVIPPSVHPEGEAYTWDVDGEPSEVNGPDAVRRVRRLAAASLLARCFPDNRRHEFCLALAGGLLRRGWTADETHEFVYAIAEAGGSDNPGARAEVASYTKSRLDGDLPTTGFNRLSEIIGDAGPFVLGCVTQWLEIEQGVEGDGDNPPLTELGVAERVAREHGGELFYVPERAQWFVWEGKRWVVDPGNRIMQLVKATIRKMSADAEEDLGKLDPDLVEALKRPKTDKREKLLAAYAPGDVLSGKSANTLLGFARSMETHAKMSAVCRLSATLEKLIKRQAVLDTNPWLLNVSNGTIDLGTGQLRAHSREDYITKLSDVAYDPHARAPRFKKFLEEVLPDPDLRSYVQRAHGYSLTGLTTEQCMFICTGTGSNGKSVLEKLRRAYMGEYIKTSPASTFLEKRNNDGPRNDLAAMAGARLIAVSETKRGQALDESLVKGATSGDVITARFLQKEFFEYEPQFKLWMSTNHRPQVNGGDNGIWRRLRVIPFEVTIPDDRQNVNLDKELIAEELPGVLAWAVEGCLRWQTHRLGKPLVMQAEIEEYRESSDPLADWVTDSCVMAGKATSNELWQSYMGYCARNGLKGLARADVLDYLRQRGCRPAKVNQAGSTQARGWSGISVVVKTLGR